MGIISEITNLTDFINGLNDSLISVSEDGLARLREDSYIILKDLKDRAAEINETVGNLTNAIESKNYSQQQRRDLFNAQGQISNLNTALRKSIDSLSGKESGLRYKIAEIARTVNEIEDIKKRLDLSLNETSMQTTPIDVNNEAVLKKLDEILSILKRNNNISFDMERL